VVIVGPKRKRTIYKEIPAGNSISSLIYQYRINLFSVSVITKYSPIASKVHHPNAEILFHKAYSSAFSAKYKKDAGKDHIANDNVRTKKILQTLDFPYNRMTLNPTKKYSKEAVKDNIVR
jgi:hypothetical protein